MYKWVSLIVETSAGVPLISMRTFAVPKRSAWLLSNESPCLSGSLPSCTKSATISYSNPCRRLLTDSTQKLLGLQKPSVPKILRRPNKRAGMPAYGQVGSATGGQWAATSPWILQVIVKESAKITSGTMNLPHILKQNVVNISHNDHCSCVCVEMRMWE